MFRMCCSSSKVVKSVDNHQNTTKNSLLVPEPEKPQKQKKISRREVAKAMQKDPLSAEVVQAIVENHIFSHVFSYLTVNELLNCRMVNKIWNKEACTVLRHKIEGVVILQRGMDYYVKLMSKSLNIPVGRVFLKLYDMNSSSVERFFEVVGHSIVYLVLNLEGKSLSAFINKLYCLTNLKELSLNLFDNGDPDEELTVARRKGTTIVPVPEIKIVVEDTSMDDNSLVRTQMPENFISLPSLESVVLSCEEDWKKNNTIALEKLIRLSSNLRNLNLLKWPFILKGDLFLNSPLEQMKFMEVRIMNQMGLEILSKKRWRYLKSIQMEFSFDITSETFSSFLESCRHTLEYLEVKNEWEEEKLPFILPVTMKELLTLRLTTWKGTVSMDSILNNAPKLNKLQLSRVSPLDIEFKELTKNNASLQFLAVNYEDTSHSPKVIYKVLKNFTIVFPNVTCLMMKRMTDKLMEIVYEGWTNLEVLNVTTTFGFSDTGITGIPTIDLKTASKAVNQLSCGCYSPARPNELRNSPYIGNLQNLKVLRIETEVGTRMTLTRYSLHLGFQQLNHLKSLKLVSHEIGPSWCLRCIADNLLELNELTIMDRAISNDRYNEQDLLFLLKTLPHLKLTFVPTSAAFSTAAHLSVPSPGFL